VSRCYINSPIPQKIALAAEVEEDTLGNPAPLGRKDILSILANK
jgi:hypothetical protein